VSVDAEPETTLVGFAASVTTGAGRLLTNTVTVWLVEPPDPEQVSVKLVVAPIAPVDVLPLVALLPAQPPEATQLDASVELQVSVEAEPDTKLVGLAANVTTGAVGLLTITVTDWLVEPPEPEQVSAKLVVAPSAPVDSLPLVALLPDHPPEAVQLDALVELHVRLADCPVERLVGVALSATTGLATAEPDPPPPPPPHPLASDAMKSAAATARVLFSREVSAF
jgi:hypothetical protein